MDTVDSADIADNSPNMDEVRNYVTSQKSNFIYAEWDKNGQSGILFVAYVKSGILHKDGEIIVFYDMPVKADNWLQIDMSDSRFVLVISGKATKLYANGTDGNEQPIMVKELNSGDLDYLIETDELPVWRKSLKTVNPDSTYNLAEDVDLVIAAFLDEVAN